MATNILLFFSGIGVFLYGLTMLSNSALSYGEKLFKIKLHKILSNSFSATTLGLTVTSIVQSSSATNSFAVKLADMDMIESKASFYLIMGSNIGTTITAYLAIIARLPVSYIIASVIFFGIIIYIFTKNQKVKTLSLAACCLSLIFIGLIIVNTSMLPIQEKIYYFITYKRNEITLFMFALLLTAILQSSSLTSVLLISMASVAVIDIHIAMLMVMGINIGSCSSVLIASIGCSKKGWIVALFHLLFNIVGVGLNLFLLKTGLLDFFINLNTRIDIKIALYHTFFNISTTLFLYYFIPEILKIFRLKNKTGNYNISTIKF